MKNYITTRANARLNRSLIFCLFGLLNDPRWKNNLVLQVVVTAGVFWTAFFAIVKILSYLF